MRSRLVIFSLAAAALTLACGGSSKSDLYGSGSKGGSYGTGGASSGGSSGSGGSAGKGGSPSGGDGGAPGGGSGGGTPTGGAGGTTSGGSGGTPTGGAGGTTSGGSAGSGGSATGGTGGGESSVVHCGGTTCDLATDFCCQYVVSDGYDPTCRNDNQSCSGGTDVYCDGPEDCPGGVCCGQLVWINSQQYYNDIKCVPAGSCDYNQDQRVFCGGDQSACPGGTYCKSSSVLPQYQFCSTQP
jgi:hypothetical protein